jgi:DNA repair protein RecN (Recombination protein N)
MLDGFARAREERRTVREAFLRWRAVEEELRELESGEQEKLRLLDLWQFQRKEIESEDPQPGEDVALEEERRIQQNAGRLQENAATAYEMLYEAEGSAYSMLRGALKKLDDPTFSNVRTALEPAALAVNEASHELRESLAKLEADPARLEEIETRLAGLGKLKRKYGASIAEILAFLDDVRRQIAGVESAEERMRELRDARGKLAAEYEKAAGRLSKLRVTAATELGRRVEHELASLAMERTVFRVAREEGPWSESGVDRVAFLVSPNRGEEPRPIEHIASGGELSRIALALKTCVAGGVKRTLVFDEVDAGIGGSAAEGVARRLKRLAAENQVLCVTHLAQIASFADHHYRVSKEETNGRTVARIEELSNDERKREIGRMLSGAKITAEALKNAERMMEEGRVTLVNFTK